MDDVLDRDTFELFGLLFSIVLEGEKRLSEHLEAHDLTAPQFYVLKSLIEAGGRMGIGEIARRHGLTNATMTGLVKRMELLNPPLVQREAHLTDGRAVVVVLSDAGTERFMAVQASFMAQLRAVFSLVPADQRRQLLNELSHYQRLVVAAAFPAG